MPHHTTEAMQQCIQECQQCFAVCSETTTHCLSMGGNHATAEHVTMLLDCADICRTAAAFMLRSSPLHARVCGVCADTCAACADSCERIGDDEQMRACAAACRRCAKSCRQMAGATA